MSTLASGLHEVGALAGADLADNTARLVERTTRP